MNPHPFIILCVSAFPFTACDAQEARTPQASGLPATPEPSAKTIADEKAPNAEDDEVLRFIRVAEKWNGIWGDRSTKARNAFLAARKEGNNAAGRGYELLMNTSERLVHVGVEMITLERLTEKITDPTKLAEARAIMFEFYKESIGGTISRARQLFTGVATETANAGLDDERLIKKLYVDTLEEFASDFHAVRVAKWASK